MSKKNANKVLEEKIQKSFSEVDIFTREDVLEALLWARTTLTNLEGAGHQFQIHSEKDRQLTCTFSKVEWSGEHCSRSMDTASEAVVMAVCEYINGA